MNPLFLRNSRRFFILFYIFSCFLGFRGNAFSFDREYNAEKQKEIIIKGKISDVRGEPLYGAYIKAKNSAAGTGTDENGEFSLALPGADLLQISFIGYKTAEIPAVRHGQYLEIIMEDDALMLDRVVVTALGLTQKESALTYSVKEIGRQELTRVKDPNMMVALTGKIAGVQINKTSSGPGGSSKVLMRGVRSVAGNNQPLYVIDGVPVLNASNEQAYTAVGGTADAGNRDGGDGVSNLNPEDVESISVLKGAPAAALYGSQAANGVILITTKKGNQDETKVVFSTNLTFDKAFCLPVFQNSYGESDGTESWGPPAEMPSYDNAGDFFRTGATSITSLSVSSGNRKYQNYFSYANTTGSGIVEENHLSKHNLNIRETASFFKERLSLDGNINLFRQVIKNRPPVGGFYMNPLVGLYRFPRGKDISQYREEFEVWDPSRNLYVQNWHSPTQDFEQNPYWIARRIQSKDVRNRVIAVISADLRLASWLKLQARGSVDHISDLIRQKFYASTAPALAGENGRYIEMTYGETMLYGDILAVADKEFGDFSLHGALGASINDRTVNSLRYDSKTASLIYPNVFNIANINANGAAYISQQIDARRQMQSVFATVQLGYKQALILDLTARNDWSSTLAFTPNEHTGFFYPSAGAAWIMNKTLDFPAWISFAKIRTVWSRVGNDIPLFITNPTAHVGAGGVIESQDAAPFEDMKPEMTTSVEAGTEWKFFNYRLSLSATYYKTNTRNQFFKLPAKSGDRYAYRYVNAGDIRNTGWEVNITGYPVSNPAMEWKSELNYAVNKNKVLELHEELPVFTYGPSGFSSSYAMKLKEGGSFGDIYGKAFKRDGQGNIIYETEGDRAGLPLVEGDGNLIKVGNASPEFTMSWANTLSFKDLTFSFLLDGRFGGKVLSQTQADMDMFGVTRATARARDAGYVMLEGHKIENVKGFYKNVAGGRTGVTEYYMYDATNIRLRELSVGYSLPKKWMESSRVFRSVSISFVARNLFFVYKNAPFDPELILSTGNDNQGIEVYGMPTARSFGFNIKCEF